MSNTLTRQPVTATIHPDLLDKLKSALHPTAFNAHSTLYHMGYEQSKKDFLAILTYRLNVP